MHISYKKIAIKISYYIILFINFTIFVLQIFTQSAFEAKALEK